MNNIENITSNTSKTPYIKPQLIELNTALGTEGRGVNMMGGIKSAIGAEGMGMSTS